jgi:hypothetical protein
MSPKQKRIEDCSFEEYLELIISSGAWQEILCSGNREVFNIDKLEDMINTEGKKLIKIKRVVNSNKSAQERIKKAEITEYLHIIKEQVDKFVGVHDVNNSEIKLYNKQLRDILRWSFPFAGSSLIAGILVSTNVAFMNGYPNIAPYTLTLSIAAAGALGYLIGKILPKLEVNTDYNRITHSIRIADNKKMYVIPFIAHEYAHHIITIKEKFCNSVVLQEGYARGIERYVSEMWAKKYDQSFQFWITDLTLGELKSVYMDICGISARVPNKNLVKMESSRDEGELLYRKENSKPTPHAIGNVFFKDLENQVGTEIYKYLLNSK